MTVRAVGLFIASGKYACQRTDSRRGAEYFLLDLPISASSDTAKTPKENSLDYYTGLAWKKRVATQSGQPYKIPVNYNSPNNFHLWDRTPHAVKLSLGNGNTDIVVVTLHMKANVGGVSITRKQRKQETEGLAAQVAAIATKFSDQDIILLGDSNVTSRTEPAVTAFTGAGFVDLNDSDDPTTYTDNVQFDRIFVRQAQPEFAASLFEVIQEPTEGHAEHKKPLSDHYMVVTELEVKADDD